MGRRIRHFNPAHSDAIKGGTCIDARFITGVADGAGVQTWNSRSGGGHTYTQATSARRPIFTLRSQGGQPAVVFTASSQHWMSRSGTAVTSTMNPYTVFSSSTTAGGRRYTQTSNTSFLVALDSANFTFYQQSAYEGGIVNTANTQVAIGAAAPTTGVHATGRSNSNTLFSLTTPVNNPVTATNANLDLSTMRSSTVPNSYSDMPLSAICIAAAAITNSFRNRIMHHYGYSFKLAL
jgi:hypothetical protein